jgi:hypothetical protein
MASTAPAMTNASASLRRNDHVPWPKPCLVLAQTVAAASRSDGAGAEVAS